MFMPESSTHPAEDHDDSRAICRDEESLTISRRVFMAGTTSGAFALWVTLRPGVAHADATAGGLKDVKGGDATPSLFVELSPDGTVRLTCHRSEMGQHVWTSVAQIIADELEADWSRIEVVQAPGHPRYGDQNTDGSRSVRRNLRRLRVVGAAMRTMLERAAAAQWQVASSSCRAENHRVVHEPTGRELEYGELAEAAASLKVPGEKEIRLKERSQWRYIGKGIASLTVPRIVRGQGTFGIDVRLPDMVHAVVARPPQVFGAVARLDDTKTRAVPGVLDVIELDPPKPPVGFQPLGGVAVLASDTWAAIRGRDALSIEWKPGPGAGYDSAKFAEEMRSTARKPGATRRERGDVDAAMAAAERTFEAEYYVPHLAQSPMEPPAATARWSGDRVEVFACVQTPQATRREVAKACSIPEDDVTVRVTWLGGGFGRKSKPDFAVEAALIARKARRPVKVTWTREDDLQHGYYHTVSAQRMEAALDNEGKCQAWLHRTVFPPIASTFQDGLQTPSWGELRLGASDNPFAVPNLRLESGDAAAHVRIGWLRSVANIYHAFAVQSFAAELAHAAGRDPLEYLLELIGPPRLFDPNTEGAEYDNYGDPLDDYPIDTGRLAEVVRLSAKMADWNQKRPEGHGLGIAVHRSFLSYVATVVEVYVDSEGQLSIPGVWSAIDAGTVVNTKHTEAQVEGGTLYGLSNALYGEITAEGGVVKQTNFPRWRVMRMNEAPRRMEVFIVPSDAPPGGVGEPPTPPAAPALANAIFDASGLRIRTLPIFKNGRSDRLRAQRA